MTRDHRLGISCHLNNWRASLIPLLMAMLAVGASVFGQSSAANRDTGSILPSLQQIVRQFDFEEPDAPPNAMPAPFFRYIAPSQGFPPFGSMRLASDVVFAGSGSFLFELAGGSMSAQIPPATVPVLPFTDYAIAVRVRTEGLVHAKARIAAWLHDIHGQPIPNSRVESRLVTSQNNWETVFIEVKGQSREAADLVIEFQVLQPAQYDRTTSGAHPQLQDLAGKVWFDDCIISHLPHLHVSMADGHHVIRQPRIPTLQLLVNEITSEALTAKVEVFDLDGNQVFQSIFPAPRGTVGEIRLPLVQCGWYRTLVEVTSRAGLTRRDWLDFAILPPRSPESFASSSIQSASQFGVQLNPLAQASMREIAPLMGELFRDRSGVAIVPIWREGDDHASGERSFDRARHQLIEDLLQHNVDLIFALERVPKDIASATGVDQHQVLKLLAKEAHHWQRSLDDLLVNFGLEVSRWQIGSLEQSESFWMKNLRPTIDAAQRSMAAFVPKPVLHTTWGFDQQILAEHRVNAYAVTLPYHVNPEAIPEYVSPWQQESEVLLVLESLPEEVYTHRQRVTDLTLRMLNAWRAGVTLIMTASPWHMHGGETGHLSPQASFPMLSNLSMRLAEQQFVGELSLARGVHCWMLRGKNGRGSSLVLWSDREQGATPLSVQVAAGPVEVIDAFGNRTSVAPVNGQHLIPVHSLPSFVENADINLLQFRGGLAITPHFVPAVAKVHEHKLVIRNPWAITISGAVRLVEDDAWRLSPATLDFTISAGSQIELPLNIVPQRSILAGHKTIEARVTLTADQTHSMTIPINVEVGLENIELAASWSIGDGAQESVIAGTGSAERDLIITLAITNHGSTAAHLDVYLLADGVGQTRRTISGLTSGETAVRTFRIANGAASLAGRQVRVGVAERNGLTRLNRLLTIAPTGDKAVAQGDER